jgi:hypothetical protein
MHDLLLQQASPSLEASKEQVGHIDMKMPERRSFNRVLIENTSALLTILNLGESLHGNSP